MARSGRLPLLLLAPAVVTLAVLFGGGVWSAFQRSLGYMPGIGKTGYNLAAYELVLSRPDFLASLSLTLYIAATATLVSAALGIAVALFLKESARTTPTLRWILQFNLTIPHLIGALGILLVFSQSGLLAKAASAMGWISKPSQFPALVYDPWSIGIILEYIWKEAPFMSLVALANLQSIDGNLDAVARSLGASRWQSLRHVVLPQISAGMWPAAAIVFAYAFGSFEVPLLLGQSEPVTLPVLAYRQYVDLDLSARPQAMATAMLIAAVSSVAVLAYGHFLRRRSERQPR